MTPRRDPPPGRCEIVLYTVGLVVAIVATLVCSVLWPMGFAS